MSSGVAVKIPRTLDFQDVTPDEFVALAQGLGALDDPPLLQPRLPWPRHLQDQTVHPDDLTTGLPEFTPGLEISTGPDTVLGATSNFTGVSPDPLHIPRAFPRGSSNEITLGPAVNLSEFSLGSSTVALIPVCTDDGCSPAKERPAGMNLAIWVKIDLNLIPAKSPIWIYGIQRHRVVFRGEFENVPPLAASKSLEDEE